MALVHDRCICLRKVEYSETSQILLLFSRDYGLQRVVAKGAHRRTKAGSSKFDGGVDLLDVGQAVFTQRLERDLGLLTEWSLREGHLELRNNLRGMYLALYAAELVGLLFEEHDAHPEAFDRRKVSVLRREYRLLLDLVAAVARHHGDARWQRQRRWQLRFPRPAGANSLRKKHR